MVIGRLMRRSVSSLFVLLIAMFAMSATLPAAAATLAVPALSATSTVNYQDMNYWLCHPSMPYSKNICNRNLKARSVEANGTATIVGFTANYNAPVDCFYVYPTASTDPLTNSDTLPDEDENQTTLSQIGRYGAGCRIFAPIYRQRTLTLLAINTLAGPLLPLDLATAAEQMAYGDVKAAFANYLKYQNKGRGFILVGHSQGATMLKRLVAEEIETQPGLHDRLIAAYLMGSTVEVPNGADVGGTFAQTPACRHADQTGCVIAYSSYREGDPELSAPRYGRATTLGNRALCVNPAALTGGVSTLDMIMPYVLPPIFQVLIKSHGTDGPYADRLTNLSAMLSTPYFAVPGQISGECVADAAGTNYLRIRIAANPSDPRADDYPAEFYGGTGWGMHLADLWLTQGDLLRLAQSQSAAWLATH